MANGSSFETPRLNEHEIHQLRRRPEFKARGLVLNGIAGAFLFAPVAYFAIIFSGVIKPMPAGQGGRIWPILALLAVANIPAQIITMKRVLIPSVEAREAFESAVQQATSALIVALAFAESVTIYGLISPFLSAPLWFAYAMMAGGEIYLAITIKVVRPSVDRLILQQMAADDAKRERERGRGW